MAVRVTSMFVGLLPYILASTASAQEPSRADTTVIDTSRAYRLPEINVTRTAEPLQRVPYAVGVVDRTEIQRGQQTVGLDEALNNLPGVVVANRYNYSLDQRISIRGAGSRSNFGVRGLKILLDGVPQTLPDGQSQLTNIDFADIDRAEVLRGASSSLYGNASGGVVALSTEAAAPGPFAQRILDIGAFGKCQRHPLALPVQGRWLPATQLGRVPPAEHRYRLRRLRVDPCHPSIEPG
jgi:iron complex outermembrane receptor protein